MFLTEPSIVKLTVQSSEDGPELLTVTLAQYPAPQSSLITTVAVTLPPPGGGVGSGVGAGVGTGVGAGVGGGGVGVGGGVGAGVGTGAPDLSAQNPKSTEFPGATVLFHDTPSAVSSSPVCEYSAFHRSLTVPSTVIVTTQSTAVSTVIGDQDLSAVARSPVVIYRD